ncbi:MAG: hypothetical protein GX442_13110 [Candidatus Riflebacteria bacterium]|nr:hypothetical protein [Candidatus Riflebacteria bacterium]
MAQELIVGKTLKETTFIVLVVVTVILGILTLLFHVNTEPEAARFCLIGAVVAGVFAVRRGIRLAAQWRTLTIDDAGFTINDRRGRRPYQDSQVLSLAMFSQTNFSQGIAETFTQQLRLWLDEGNGRYEQVDLELTHPVQAPNPFLDLEKRLADRLTDKARAVLDKGNEVVGEGWKLDQRSLAAQTPAGPRRLYLDQVADIGVFDRELCVWQKDEDEPFFRIPAKSMNALLLERLLREKLAGQLGQGEPPTGSLGRVLFERKSEAGWAWFWGGGALLVTVAAFALTGGEVVPMVILLLCAGGLAALAAWMRRWRFRCHQYGVSQRGLFSEPRLMYRDMISFTYTATRMFVNGVYSGTSLNLTFVPAPGPGRQTISFNTTLQGIDEELDGLRQHIAQVIAGRLLDELKAGRAVDWTPNLRFLPDFTLEFRAPGMLWGSHPPVIVPITSIVNMGFNAGTLNIWVQGNDTSVINELASSPNFWPGFHLLSALLAPPPAEPAPAGPAAPTP